jgi:antitoxin MazE
VILHGVLTDGVHQVEVAALLDIQCIYQKERAMLVEVVKWGNSNAVRLPASALKELHVARGDLLDLKMQDGKIVLAPAPRQYQLADMLAKITKNNQHALVDFGTPVGRETW